MRYLLRFFNASDPSASLKHAAYALVVTASVLWLSWDIARAPMSPNWVAAFTALLAAVVAAKIVGKPSSAPASDADAPSAPRGASL